MSGAGAAGGASSDANTGIGRAVTMAKPGRMYEKPDQKAKVVRDLDPGMMLDPGGEKEGVWWRVADELGNEGWVPSTLFQPAK